MKKRTAIIFTSLMVLFFASSFVNTAAKNSWLNGQWHGEKYQSNAGKAWVTDLTVDTKSNTYAISYSELNCKGKLELVSANKNRAVFIEKLEEGACISDGYIIITKVDEKHISFTCLRDNKQRLASFSTLEKK